MESITTFLSANHPDSDGIISSFSSNIEFWLKQVQQLAAEIKQVNSPDLQTALNEINQLTAFLKGRLFKRLIDIKTYPEGLRIKYLKCLEPYYSKPGIARFLTRYFSVAVLEDDKLGYRKKEDDEKEIDILFDLYRVKKTIETISTLQSAAANQESFPSQFDQAEQQVFLKTLKEIFKLFFIRFVKKEYQKELFDRFSDKRLEPAEILNRKEAGVSYLKPEIFSNSEHRDKFITVLFSTLLRTKTSDSVTDLKFNYLNFELLKNEFLTDWMLRKLKGNQEKEKILQNYRIGDRSMAEMISQDPQKEAEILNSIPIDTFNDIAEQINQQVRAEDKTPVATLSNNHGFLAQVQKGFEQAKKSVRLSHKKNKRPSGTNQTADSANALIEKVTKNNEAREEATRAMEKFLDAARDGIVNKDEITGFIEQMIGKTSSDAISAIANLKKSDQTYGHCVDVAGIFTKVCTHVLRTKQQTTVFQNDSEVTFAGFMHDFGKSKIPKSILDSSARFELDSPEMKMIRTHPEVGVELFEELKQPTHLHNLVRYHHVKLSTNINSSYPENMDYNDVIWETRLLSIVDVYQALVGKRTYKKSWTPPAAIRYLDALAGTEYDPEVWGDFMQVMGLYPVGSLVKLTDDSLAFVVNVPDVDLEKPGVVVVQDAAGRKPDRHSLIDLRTAGTLAIKEDVDAQDIFGDEAVAIFANIQLS